MFYVTFFFYYLSKIFFQILNGSQINLRSWKGDEDCFEKKILKFSSVKKSILKIMICQGSELGSLLETMKHLGTHLTEVRMLKGFRFGRDLSCNIICTGGIGTIISHR